MTKQLKAEKLVTAFEDFTDAKKAYEEGMALGATYYAVGPKLDEKRLALIEALAELL